MTDDTPLYQQIEAYFTHKSSLRDDDPAAQSRDSLPDHTSSLRYVPPLNVEPLTRIQLSFEGRHGEIPPEPYYPRLSWYQAYSGWLGLHSAIVGFNDDHEMIWIDDPQDDEDFSYFLRKERIFEQNLDAFRMANILCATKLNYLISAKVISSITDVPQHSDQPSLCHRLLLRYRYRHLSLLPPQMNTLDGVTTLGFYVWRSYEGYIIRIDCTWDGTHFTHRHEILASRVGAAHLEAGWFD